MRGTILLLIAFVSVGCVTPSVTKNYNDELIAVGIRCNELDRPTTRIKCFYDGILVVHEKHGYPYLESIRDQAELHILLAESVEAGDLNAKLVDDLMMSFARLHEKYEIQKNTSISPLILLPDITNQGKRLVVLPSSQRGVASEGIPVYSREECIGPIVMGVCDGAIIPQKAYRPRCYGEMLNGVCTGPIF